jgi:hypothetical protein
MAKSKKAEENISENTRTALAKACALAAHRACAHAWLIAAAAWRRGENRGRYRAAAAAAHNASRRRRRACASWRKESASGEICMAAKKRAMKEKRRRHQQPAIIGGMAKRENSGMAAGMAEMAA